MAIPTIPNGKDYFNTILYTGTGAEHAVTGVGFQPDNVVIKRRDSAADWGNWDTSRGVTKNLKWNKTDGEGTEAQSLKTFGTDGFTLGTGSDYNGSGGTFVAYNWLANGGTTVSNTDGNTTVTLQKNTTAGFSIGTFTSTVAAQTLGHGLGVAPEFIILKRRDGTQNWFVYHKQIDLTDAHYMHLNNTDAEQTGSDFGNTLPTSTVFTANPTGVAGRTYVFYAWNSVEGYSKFGKYVGNGNADGPFVYTGFKVSWLMVKETSNANNWYIWDAKRSPINPINKRVVAEGNYAEVQDRIVDFLSNGFKIREANNAHNRSSGNFTYMAFASNPFVGDGTNPVTAR